jgi:hypothetical protein
MLFCFYQQAKNQKKTKKIPACETPPVCVQFGAARGAYNHTSFTAPFRWSSLELAARRLIMANSTAG